METRILFSIDDLNNIDVNGCGIIPFSFHNSELYFLFGRESKEIRWAEKGLWADFGGKIDKEKESNFDGMIREFWEETNGFFGEKEKIKKYITENIEKILFFYSDCYKGIILFLPVKFEKNISIYFHNSYIFSKKMLGDKKEVEKVRKNGFLEKDGITWFRIQDIKKNIKKFRKCNREIIKLIEDNFSITD